MAGGFTNRWVCVVKNGLELKPSDVKKLDGHIWSEKGRKFELRRLIKIDPPIKYKRKIKNKEIQEVDSQIISGRLYFQREVEIVDYEITDEGEINEEKEIERRTSVVPFWASFTRPLILFKNSQEYTKTGKRVLARLFFGDEEGIEEVSFDIEAIEDDWEKGMFDMWAYSFRDRQGTINKGSLFSEQRINAIDPLYQDTVGAPRNFVGIYVTFGTKEVKVRVTRDGTVTIYGNFEDPMDQPTIVNFINDLVSKYRIQS